MDDEDKAEMRADLKLETRSGFGPDEKAASGGARCAGPFAAAPASCD